MPSNQPYTKPAPVPEAAPDGTVWIVPRHDDVYHVFNCLPVAGARNAGITIEQIDVDGPESLAGRLMCHACARRLGHTGWNPTTGTPFTV